MSVDDDNINDLLDQASAHVKQLLNNNSDDFDVSCNFTFPTVTSTTDILNDKHNLIRVQECTDKNNSNGNNNQRGMYAKCDINAGTNIIIAKPIVAYFDIEDDDEDDDDTDDDDEDDDDNDDEEDSFHDLKDYEKSVENSKMKAKDIDADEKTTSDREENDDDDDDDDLEQEPTGTKRNGLLILRALEMIKQSPTLWTNTLNKLFPRDVDTSLGLHPWFCSDAQTGMSIDREMTNLSSLSLFEKDDNEQICKEIGMRLPLIVRYNVLSIETCSELFVYPDVSKGGLAGLAGTGLYGPEVSYFNHSCIPNVSRYCIGDVMFFVTNRDITKGDELCFSYIEHELLCENASKRSALLDMDFELNDDDNESTNEQRANKKQKVAKQMSKEQDDTDDLGVCYPLIDAEMQSELLATPSDERLDIIDELLDKEIDPVQDYQCDKYQLHILKAITLDGLGKSRMALVEWEEALDFALKNFPPLDESTVALYVQAALCAQSDDKIARAKDHANKALTMHNSLFGGGNTRFMKRYEKEFDCPMRNISNKMSVEQLFGKQC